MRAKTKLDSLFLLSALACLAPHNIPAQAPQDQDPTNVILAQTSGGKHPAILEEEDRNPGTANPTLASEKQRKSLLHANLAKSKKDAEELAALAREFQEQLNNPKMNSLPSDDVARLERIEKLAKKIRQELKGY